MQMSALHGHCPQKAPDSATTNQPLDTTTPWAELARTVDSEKQVFVKCSLPSAERAWTFQRLPAGSSGPDCDLWCRSGTKFWMGRKKLSDLRVHTAQLWLKPGLCPPRHVALLGGLLIFLAPGCQGWWLHVSRHSIQNHPEPGPPLPPLSSPIFITNVELRTNCIESCWQGQTCSVTVEHNCLQSHRSIRPASKKWN